MFSMILSILKLLFIILACIILALLIIILVVLITPVRYEFAAKANETVFAYGKITWLLRIFYFKLTYLENHLDIRFSIFGKVIYRYKQNSEPSYEETETELEDTVLKNGLKKKRKKVIRKKEKKKVVHRKEENKISGKVTSETEKVKKTKKVERSKTLEHGSVSNKIETETKKEVKEDHTERDINSSYMKKRSSKKIKSEKDTHETKENLTVFGRIKQFFLHIKAIILNVINSIISVHESYDKIKVFFVENKLGFKVTFHSLKRILNHSKPKKFDADIEFGTGDPCSTGQILGIASILYGFYGEHISIVPNFEDEVLKGSVFLKGRIRLFTLLIIGIKLILDENFKVLLNKLKALKEEL